MRADCWCRTCGIVLNQVDVEDIHTHHHDLHPESTESYLCLDTFTLDGPWIKMMRSVWPMRVGQ